MSMHSTLRFRRWLQFGLRPMLLLTLGVAIYCGGYRRGYDRGCEDRPAASVADFDRLIDLIAATVRPTTWEDVGGPGSIEPFGGGCALTVRNDPFGGDRCPSTDDDDPFAPHPFNPLSVPDGGDPFAGS